MYYHVIWFISSGNPRGILTALISLCFGTMRLGNHGCDQGGNLLAGFVIGLHTTIGTLLNPVDAKKTDRRSN